MRVTAQKKKKGRKEDEEVNTRHHVVKKKSVKSEMEQKTLKTRNNKR